MVEPFIRHASEILLDTPIFAVRQDLCEHPRTGERRPYVVLEQRDWVNVVALTTDEQLILIRQWRHGTRRVELEIPAGIVDDGESPIEAGARELREETGYEAASLELIGAVAPNPAYQSNTCYTLLARGCRLAGAQQLDAGEDIEVELMSIAGLRERAAVGELQNAMVISALFWWLERERAR